MLIYPVCGDVYLLDLSNIVENFKNSKWVKSLGLKIYLKNWMKLLYFLISLMNRGKKVHVRGGKMIYDKNFHLESQSI